MSGNYGRAYRNFDRSLKTARKQKADFEVATTILVQNEFALELGWVNNASELKDAVEFVSKVKLSMSNHDPSKSISLLDRFGSLLEVGRKSQQAFYPRTSIKLPVTQLKEFLGWNKSVWSVVTSIRILPIPFHPIRPTTLSSSAKQQSRMQLLSPIVHPLQSWYPE